MNIADFTYAHFYNIAKFFKDVLIISILEIR